MSYVNKFKDCSASETVNKLKSTINKLGITLKEEWISSVEGIYSVHISVVNSSIFSNGKGVSRELAQASGYAELLERLQNMLPFRLSDCYQYYFSVDKEPKLFSDDIIDLGYENCRQKKWMEEFLNKEEIKVIKNILITYRDNSRKVQNIQFYNFNSPNDSILIPQELLDFYYGSNGMAAGNTKEETLVQAISEIVERYSIFNILKDKSCELMLPNITEFVRGHYSLSKAIEELEKNGLNVSVLDLSVHTGMPVIATVVKDPNKMSYFISAGCHPILDIAIERSITEFLQGRDVKNIDDMTSVIKDFSEVDDTGNKNNIFRDGVGVYPPSILDTSHIINDALSKYWATEFKDNKDMLKYYVELLESKGRSIYVKDNNILDFNTYHVIIPGMSETTNNVKELERYLQSQQARESYCEVSNGNYNNIANLINFWDRDEMPDLMTLGDILNLPLCNNSLKATDNISKTLLLSMLYSFIGNNEKSYQNSKKYLDFLVSQGADNYIIKYYKTVTAIFYLRKLKLKDKRIINILIGFSTEDYIRSCMKDLEKDNILSNLPRVSCPNCGSCDLESICYFKEEKNIFSTLVNISLGN